MTRGSLTALAAALALRGAGAPAGNAPNTRPTPDSAGTRTQTERARQALSRLSFGARPGDVARVEAMGVDRWIARQLSPDSIPDGINVRLQSMETQRKSAAELIADHPTPQEIMGLMSRSASDSGMHTASLPDSAALRRAQQTTGVLANELLAAKTLRALASDRQLLEVMTDFWQNHCSVFVGKLPTPYALVHYDRH